MSECIPLWAEICRPRQPNTVDKCYKEGNLQKRRRIAKLSQVRTCYIAIQRTFLGSMIDLTVLLISYRLKMQLSIMGFSLSIFLPGSKVRQC